MHPSATDFVEGVLDLLWSAWGGLGLRAVRRQHDGVVVDPEPLLVLSAHFFSMDLRLRDEVARWCRGHGHLLSASRLQALMRAEGHGDTHPLATFAGALRAQPGSPRWSFATAAAEGPLASLPRLAEADPIPYQRPACTLLRLRCLLGPGCRADMIGALLAQSGHWFRAADLSRLGYTKRACATALKELAAAGWIHSREQGNALTYSLPANTAWCGPWPRENEQRWWPWWAIAQALLALRHLWDAADASPRVQTIEAQSHLATATRLLRDSGADLQLPSPPPANTEAQEIQTWALDWLGARARGEG